MARNTYVRIAMVAMVAIFAVLIAAAGNELAHWLGWIKPLGDSPPLRFPASPIPKVEVQKFLEGDFRTITGVKALPGPVLQTYTEIGGSRLLMANPGGKFQVTDVIYDRSLPRMRLIFAGVLDEKCFVHYEQGGRGLTYMLVLFDVTSSGSMKPVWKGYCIRPAANIGDLRSQVAAGSCRPPGR